MSEAYVTCRDGRGRIFRGDPIYLYRGTKKMYRLYSEPDGRGFLTMVEEDGILILAPQRMQPTRIVARTWAGMWTWEAREQ
jgi:hypothetical protein